MSLLHPSSAKLTAWLEGTASDEKLDRHLGGCARCATNLEGLAPPHSDLRVPLATALQAPTDLVPRLQTGVRKRLEGRQDLRLLGQMLGLPLRTARLLLEEEPG
jgi:hypothetical protein